MPHGSVSRRRERLGPLRHLAVELGLIEELPPERAGTVRAYRLAEKGRRAVERIPLKDPRWRLPYEDAEFFVKWDVDDLVKYIRINYPEYDLVVRDERVGRPTV